MMNDADFDDDLFVRASFRYIQRAMHNQGKSTINVNARKNVTTTTPQIATWKDQMVNAMVVVMEG